MRGWFVAFVALTLVLTGGCVETKKLKIVPPASASVSSEAKIPVTAALVLDQEFKNQTCKMNLIGGSRIFLLGEHLVRYAQDVSGQLFSHVLVFDSESAAAGSADVLLVPKLARSSFTGPVPFKALLRAEWAVKDRTGQQVVWIGSIDGQATVKPKAFGTAAAERRAWQGAYDDLSARTLQAFRESPEIARLGR